VHIKVVYTRGELGHPCCGAEEVRWLRSPPQTRRALCELNPNKSFIKLPCTHTHHCGHMPVGRPAAVARPSHE
jgi:hypothetical protein